MFDIRTEPNANEFINELLKDVDDFQDSFLKFLAENAPGEMQKLMMLSTPSGNPTVNGGKRSAFGQPPAIDTRELLTSLRGQFLGSKTEIEMADHAKWLDPFFDGYLNRPFIEEAIDTSINKGMQQIN